MPHVLLAESRVDGGDDAGCLEPPVKCVVAVDGVDDGAGLCEPGRFDQHAVEPGNFLAQSAVVEGSEGVLNGAAGQAAKTPRVEQLNILVICAVGNKRLVQADVAKLIDDDRTACKPVLMYQASQQCRLSTAEKSGQKGDRYPCVPHDGWRQ